MHEEDGAFHAVPEGAALRYREVRAAAVDRLRRGVSAGLRFHAAALQYPAVQA